MRKIFFLVSGVFFPFLSFASSFSGEVEIQPSSSLSVQKVFPEQKNVRLFSFSLTGKNNFEGAFRLSHLKISHSGEPLSQFLNYRLLLQQKVLSKQVSVSESFLEIPSLTVDFFDGKTQEITLVADIAAGDISGEHLFFLENSESVLFQRSSSVSSFPVLKANFPVLSSPILITPSALNLSSPLCRLQEQPVCGEDGRTYFNSCIPFYKKIAILHDGACTVEEQEKILFSSPREKCSDVFEPVCGTDHQTYFNLCTLSRKKDIQKKHDGECLSLDQELPSLFFDMKQKFFSQKDFLLSQKSLSVLSRQQLLEIYTLLDSFVFSPFVAKQVALSLSDFMDAVGRSSFSLDQQVSFLYRFFLQAQKDSANEKYLAQKIPFLYVEKKRLVF